MLKSNVFDRNVPKNGCLSFQTVTNSFRSHWHSHSEYEIVYIQSGQGTIQYGNTFFDYHEGHLFLLGPWVPHEFTDNSANHHSISFLFTESLLSLDLFQCDLSLKIKKILKDSIFGSCFNLRDHKSLAENYINIGNQQCMERALNLFTLLQNLTRIDRTSLQSPITNGLENARFYKRYAQLQKILAYINLHLSEKLTLQDIADQFYVSKSYLSQLFNDLIQTTFTDYLLHQRLYYACRLLSTSNQSITDISDQVGFASQSSFNRSFLKIKQMSPRDYRKRLMTH